MTILKRDTKNSEKQFLGAHLPEELSRYLTLYSLYHRKTKTSIVKRFLTQWMRSVSKEYPIDSLIEGIAKKAFESWSKPKGKRENFNSFCRLLRAELAYKGLSEECVEKIMKIMEDGKNKEG